jgi:hypothetical protein
VGFIVILVFPIPEFLSRALLTGYLSHDNGIIWVEASLFGSFILNSVNLSPIFSRGLNFQNSGKTLKKREASPHDASWDIRLKRSLKFRNRENRIKSFHPPN